MKNVRPTFGDFKVRSPILLKVPLLGLFYLSNSGCLWCMWEGFGEELSVHSKSSIHKRGYLLISSNFSCVQVRGRHIQTFAYEETFQGFTAIRRRTEIGVLMSPQLDRI